MVSRTITALFSLAVLGVLCVGGFEQATAIVEPDEVVFENIADFGYVARGSDDGPVHPAHEALAADVVADDPEPEPDQESDVTQYGCSYSIDCGQAYEGGASDFRSQGVVHDNGVTYTWYSENVLPGGGLSELNANGRTVNDSGFVTDGDGSIAVASSDYPIGTKLDTPWGPATVYDTGCASGVVDVYVGW